GIRDSSVTGVQTCALPISLSTKARLSKPGWDEKSRSPERDAISSQVIHALEAQENKETGMKKINTTTTKAFRKMEELTIGLDLGDRSSWYCVLDERGELVLEQKVSTTAKAIWKRCSGHAREPHPTGDRDALAV